MGRPLRWPRSQKWPYFSDPPRQRRRLRPHRQQQQHPRRPVGQAPPSPLMSSIVSTRDIGGGRRGEARAMRHPEMSFGGAAPKALRECPCWLVLAVGSSPRIVPRGRDAANWPIARATVGSCVRCGRPRSGCRFVVCCRPPHARCRAQAQPLSEARLLDEKHALPRRHQGSRQRGAAKPPKAIAIARVGWLGLR